MSRTVDVAGLVRFRRAIARAIETFKYELTPNGIHVRSVGQIRGVYALRVNGGPEVEYENILPVEGLILMLNLLGNHTSAAFFAGYIALYATAVTPLSTHTGASFPAASGEITSGTEGYTQSTRVNWVTATAAGTAVIHNNASPAVFTIATATTITANGIAMYTTSAKGDVAGKLISASRFGAARVFSDTDEVDVKYQLGLSST
jgi:hypothetical protein